MSKYPLRLEPFVKQVVWGGDWLAKTLHRTGGDSALLGESWEAYSGSVIANGEWRGQTLDEVFLREGEAFSGPLHDNYPRFPLLAKFIDAHQNLSIQVHPDNRLALELENYPYGKTEFWYVLDAAPHAHIYYGLNGEPTHEQQLAEALANQTILEHLQKVPVRAGDLVFIPAGTIHALAAGIVVYELQQNSDITYRLYDWGRTDREIHLDKGLKCIDFSCAEMAVLHPTPVDHGDYESMELANCYHFYSKWCRIKTHVDGVGANSSFILLTVIAGCGRIVSLDGTFEPMEMPAGTTLCLPAGLKYRLENGVGGGTLDGSQPFTLITGALGEE